MILKKQSTQMPLLLTAPPDYLEIIHDAETMGENLLIMYHQGVEFNILQDEWYIFEERASAINLFFEFGFEDEEFQDFWFSRFMEQNSNELNAIRNLIEDEEDNKTIILDYCEIIECE
jgi:hypothetical protein